MVNLYGVVLVTQKCMIISRYVSECNSGTFGQNCKNVCEGCISSMCDRIDGLCYNTSGCEHGYLYDKYCNKST